MRTFLRRLELQGFKSFAGKTVFEFPERITAIVGPNGSGKSNIIDALRWALGEREAKQLRGDTLGTLIFSGTPKRAPVGFAKVTLCFDNADRLLSMETEEVELVRRIERSGASQFFLNNAETRLKDLISLLARARLGTRGMSMIGQGQGDLFVGSSPQDRRSMIEEVLGLREFRLKKNEAERRLAASESNMEKVKALLEELTPHLRFLRRQRTRWEKRSEIEQDLKEMENEYFSFRLHELEREGAGEKKPTDLESRKKNRESEIRNLNERIEDLNKTQEEHPDELRTIREKLRKKMEERNIAQRALAKIEAKIELLEQRKGENENRSQSEYVAKLQQLAREMEEVRDEELNLLKEKVAGWIKTIKSFLSGGEKEKGDENLEQERKTVLGRVKTMEEESQGLQKNEEMLLEQERGKNKEFRVRIEELEKKKNELREIDRQIQEIRFEAEKNEIRMVELEREWQNTGRSAEEFKLLANHKQKRAEHPEESARKMLRLRNELSALGEIDRNLLEEAEETEKRHEFLSRESEDLAKASHDLKNLIQDLDRRIHAEFKNAFRSINQEFSKYFRLMFGGGKASLKLQKSILQVSTEQEEGKETILPENDNGEGDELAAGVEVELNLPRKKITSLDMLSGGEKSLVSLAALFALISVSPPPFLVLDEIDAPLDEDNAHRFTGLIKEFAKTTQFIVVTHNRITMEAADVLYGITMGDDGASKVLSLKLEEAETAVN